MAIEKNNFKLIDSENQNHCSQFQWDIEYSLLKNDEELACKKFSMPKCSTSVQVVVKPTICQKMNEIEVGIRRIEDNGIVNSINISFDFEINSGNVFISSESMEFSFSKVIKIVFSGKHKISQSNFRLTGNITILQCCDRKSIENENFLQLQQDFKAFMINKLFTDVRLQTENDVIDVHKFVLCSRSPVFRKMFENDMKENKEKIVKIDDIDKSALEIFVNFLYTGFLNVCAVAVDTVIALYSIADKYEVKTLQNSCRDILLCNINQNTVVTILKIADMHSDGILKNAAIQFICQNFAKVSVCEHWNKLLRNDPCLVSDTLREVSTSLPKS